MIRNGDNDTLARKQRSSICRSSVLNFGKSSRVHGVGAGVGGGGGPRMPRWRKPRDCLPSHASVMRVIMKCLPMCGPDGMDRFEFQRRFEKAKENLGKDDSARLCLTPISWIEKALPRNYSLERLHCLDDFFPRQEKRANLSEFIIMDVILNRRLLRASADVEGGGIIRDGGEHDPDAVRYAPAYCDDDLLPDRDFLYRTLIAFLPGAGVLYCPREHRGAEVGVEGSLIPLDMSWLRLHENVTAGQGRRYSFGEDSYVKCFFGESEQGGVLPMITAWRVSTGHHLGRSTMRRVVHAMQCSDADGPRMPPDFVAGQAISSAWPAACLGQEYNKRLARSKSTRIGGRYYAQGCLHWRIPDDCLVIDVMDDPDVDIVVDVAPIGSCKSKKSIVMIRNVADDPSLVRELRAIVLHNMMVRGQLPAGSARASKGDIGAMHPIGTRVHLDGVTLSEYATQCNVNKHLVSDFVTSMARMCSFYFPDVLSVIQDVEADSSALPCKAMAGKASGGSGNGAGDVRFRVGFSIDMSVDMANATHYDVGDCSQGISVWLEEMPGLATGWYFVMPNMYCCIDGRMYNGIAIRLRHGTAISWDGRVVRHGTSVSHPDGLGTPIVGHSGGHSNHLYGTFTAAKERVVNAGRARAATATATATASTMETDAKHPDGDEVRVGEVYYPTIEDADPDSLPPPKDGSECEWLQFWRWMRDERLNSALHGRIPRKRQRN